MMRQTISIVLLFLLIIITGSLIADDDIVLKKPRQNFHFGWTGNIIGRSRVVVLKNVIAVSADKTLYRVQSSTDDVMIIGSIPAGTTAYNVNIVVHGEVCYE